MSKSKKLIRRNMVANLGEAMAKFRSTTEEAARSVEAFGATYQKHNLAGAGG